MIASAHGIVFEQFLVMSNDAFDRDETPAAPPTSGWLVCPSILGITPAG